MTKLNEVKLAIIGLGYVGLPLAAEFSKKGFSVIGFDINEDRVNRLKDGFDDTDELTPKELAAAKGMFLTSNRDEIAEANFYIVTVPTPIDGAKNPDLRPLQSASNLVGAYLKKGDVVVYESTTYPGCTEEVCVPLLEEKSGLVFNEDFYCGYSPERINPGDKKRKVHNIVKVTSGSTPEAAELIDSLYGSIVTVGTHKASSLKVAEASKIIENIQRDLNISLVNELALIFDRLGIDTLEVLEAAGTKWNFLPFRPGLVGGHCISVDPYYLTYKAESLGYYPEVIHSGRRINENMGSYIANRVVKLMVKSDLRINRSEILVLGVTFKENCPDIRNSRVVDMIREFEGFGAKVTVHDPYASAEEVKGTYGIDLEPYEGKKYEAIVLAVGHKVYKGLDLENFKALPHSVVFDIKSFLPKENVTQRL